jgi:hypothetical protein
MKHGLPSRVLSRANLRPCLALADHAPAECGHSVRDSWSAPPRNPIRRTVVENDEDMLGTWLQDLESLEAISQDDDAKRIFLRMAALSREGQMGDFLTELADDEDLDDETKGTLSELARDSTFLLAVEDYVQRTQRLH